MMQKNIGPTNRVIRAIVGVALAVAGPVFIGGRLGIAFLLAGELLAFSASVGFCHVYKVLGICDESSEACATKR